MLKLNSKVEVLNLKIDNSSLFKLTSDDSLPMVIRKKYALLGDKTQPGFGAYLVKEFNNGNSNLENIIKISDDFSYLRDGDIIRLDSSSHLNCIFRNNAKYNTFLLTERCNHYCLMCSQPPKRHDDSWLMESVLESIELLPKNLNMIGFSGGEPTLYGDKLVQLIQKTKNFLPNTGIDILTNGRAFIDLNFVKKIQKVNHAYCMFAIPLYSDDPSKHNYIVQADNAYDETLQGILNLKSHNQKVEIRIVIHKQSIDTLINLCEFITKNLIFVDHVALMGLEITGFTRANLKDLWIDPYDYKDILSAAVKILNKYNIQNSVYNHQLCTVNNDVYDNYQKSISDWKNEYVEECTGCLRKNECGGFFSSSKKYKYSDHIKPLKYDIQ